MLRCVTSRWCSSRCSPHCYLHHPPQESAWSVSCFLGKAQHPCSWCNWCNWLFPFFFSSKYLVHFFLPCTFSVEKEMFAENLQFLQFTPASDFIRPNWVILFNQLSFIFYFFVLFLYPFLMAHSRSVVHLSPVFARWYTCQSCWWKIMNQSAWS